ncbi:polymorphic toxin type 17 domain-containing protein [Orbus sturtevantii]|uniref:polymorphic toxin type 17 domain-containing protein n=1 Tax=Orbus sturtevantii TaxID=3074109 RepID=UPI00370D1910
MIENKALMIFTCHSTLACYDLIYRYSNNKKANGIASMYFYQLLSAKEWQQREEAYQLARQQGSHYLPKPKRIKHFYDTGYDDIVNQLVSEPSSCKNFYPVLQQTGLPYQSYYDKIPDKVSHVLKTALFTGNVVLIELPPQGGYYGASSANKPFNAPLSLVKKQPVYEPDDSWLVVDLVNHSPELLDIRDGGNIQQVISNVQTSANDIFLKHSDTFSVSQVLPKVHILLGGNHGDSDLTLRGEKPLRVKKLAQQWLDELSALLRAGNSPFTLEQDEALASAINVGFSSQHYAPVKKLDDKALFRPDERIGALFYHVLLVLNQTDFITATERIGELGYDEAEGAITDSKLLKQAITSLRNLRHSEGYDKADYGYHSDKLAKTASEYLGNPLIFDGTGEDNDYETKLKQQVEQDTQADELRDIESLYFNAIKLLKQLRAPGLIKHVQTRRSYRLKVTKLNYQYIELPHCEGFYLELHKDHKYAITSVSQGHRFVGRFNQQGLADIKIPQKWAQLDDWQLVTTAVDVSFIDEYFGDISANDLMNASSGAAMGSVFGPLGALAGGLSGYLYGDEIKSTYLEYENQILGGAQVAGGVLTLAVAGTIEVGSLGTGTAAAVALGFIGSDNIAAGMSRMLTDKEVLTLGEDAIAWSGLAPKGYEGIVYGLVDLTLGSKMLALSKVPSATHNIVSIRAITPAGQKPSLLKDIQVYIDKLSKNSKKQRHVIELKEPTFNPHGSMGAAKPWTIAQRLKYAKLPTTGKIRFVPSQSYHPNQPLPKGNSNGYLDKFLNEWVKGPSRTVGQEFEWDVQLSKLGEKQLGWASRDGKHLNVSLDGKITHK